jgi:hypothetical protein
LTGIPEVVNHKLSAHYFQQFLLWDWGHFFNETQKARAAMSGNEGQGDDYEKNVVTEFYTVEIHRHVPSGVAAYEIWKNEKGQTHRPPQDGPAVVGRLVRNGQLIEQTYVINGEHVDPNVAGVTRPDEPQRKEAKRLEPR